MIGATIHGAGMIAGLVIRAGRVRLARVLLAAAAAVLPAVSDRRGGGA